MTSNEQVLLESQTARNTQLEKIEDRAEELLSKANALHFNVWQETGIATTGQVAEFYEVPIKTVESALKCHRSEFDSDGLKVLRGEDLKLFKLSPEFVTLNFKVTNKARNVTIWNPRATLRLGYLLRNSVIAKTVRTTSLDFIEKASQQTAPPKTQAEMLIIYAQEFFNHDQRIKSVESDMQEMKQIRIDATEQINRAALPPAKTETPILETRRALLHAVNLYCRKEVVDPQNAWNLLYEQLRLRCGFAVKKRNHLKNESHLDVVVRHGYLDKIYAIALDYFGLNGSKPASSGN